MCYRELQSQHSDLKSILEEEESLKRLIAEKMASLGSGSEPGEGEDSGNSDTDDGNGNAPEQSHECPESKE